VARGAFHFRTPFQYGTSCAAAAAAPDRFSLNQRFRHGTRTCGDLAPSVNDFGVFGVWHGRCSGDDPC
jgi:hypothetical protein